MLSLIIKRRHCKFSKSSCYHFIVLWTKSILNFYLCNNIFAFIGGPCVQEVNQSLLFIMVDLIISCRNSEVENGEKGAVQKRQIYLCT